MSQVTGAPAATREAAWVVLGLALPLSIAGANVGWVLLLLTVLFAAASGLKTDWRAAATPLLVPLGLCLGTALLSAAAAPSFSWGALKGDAHRLAFTAVLGLGLAGLPKGARLKALAGFVAGAGIAAAAGVTMLAWSSRESGQWGRAQAFVHPVTYGELMSFATLALAALLASPGELPKGASARRSVWALLAAVAAALVLSGTRGAVLGVSGGLFAVALAVPRLRRLAMAGVPAAALAFAAADLLPQLGRRSVLAEWSGSGTTLQSFRLTLWSAGWRMLESRPATGVGPGNFRTEYPRFAALPSDREQAFGNAHNLFIHHFAERGLIGGAATLLLFVLLWLRALRAARQPDALSLAALGATVGFTIMNLTEVALQTEQISMAFFFLWLLPERNSRSGTA